MTMTLDERYMFIALELASTARGNTSPNPLVGAVIVKNDRIVGVGFHQKAGEAHAEVHAFQMAGDHAKGATLYVTLEPCSHYGKTPPCVELVISKKVSRVVIAMEDPNELVAGRGIRRLQEEGIEVTVGVLEKEARRLNERFICNMVHKRPFIISKYAMTLDGKIATHTGDSKWITSEEARLDVHQLRHEVDGILVGIQTVLKDNPSLTTRLPHKKGKNPTRIVLDSELQTPLHYQICNEEARTIIITKDTVSKAKAQGYIDKGIQVLYVPTTNGKLDLTKALHQLLAIGITDILVEGGGSVHASFFKERLVDKVITYIGPKILGGKDSITPVAGMNPDWMKEATNLKFDEVEKIGPDLKITSYLGE